MGNGTNWSSQISCLVESGYQAIVMDTRGHGRSTSGNLKFSYELFAHDVGSLIDELQLEEVNLVGWSDGACTALEVARTRPQMVTGVVFFACNVDPSGTLEFQMTESIQNCLVRHQLDFKAMTPTLERFEDLQPKLEPMQKNEPNYAQDQLKEISTAVVVIQGDHDEFIKREHAKYIAKSLGNGHFKILEGLSHFAPIQDPEKFNGVMLQCIRLFEKNH
jgi:pimeloyl-ACP methyl ester carboxylesterase